MILLGNQKTNNISPFRPIWPQKDPIKCSKIELLLICYPELKLSTVWWARYVMNQKQISYVGKKILGFMENISFDLYVSFPLFLSILSILYTTWFICPLSDKMLDTSKLFRRGNIQPDMIFMHIELFSLCKHFFFCIR